MMVAAGDEYIFIVNRQVEQIIPAGCQGAGFAHHNITEPIGKDGLRVGMQCRSNQVVPCIFEVVDVFAGDL